MAFIGKQPATQTDIETIGGVSLTSTAAELNLIDGDTARGTTAVASGDGILINDAGTMRMTNVDTVSTYFASHSVGGTSIVTTGALNAGSITSGFGTIDTGSSAITTTGLITGGSLDIDDVLINGATIGHTDDTDLITLADGNVTIAGELDLTTLDVSGNVDVDGTLEADAITVNGTALDEFISDTIGTMVTSNTESGITVAYDDNDNTLDFTVATLNQDTTGTADNFTVTANNSANETVYPVFVDGSTGSQGAETDSGLTYNPSTGNLAIGGELAAATLDISGNVDVDGTLEADAYTVDGVTLAEYITDTAGAMVGSNTESGITVTFQDGDNTLDFSVDAAQTGITSILATDLKIGEDDQTKIDFETPDEIHLYAANAEQVYVADGIFGPQTDSDVDLGSSSVRWKDAYVDSLTTTGNLSIGGNFTVNGTTTTVNSTTVTIDDPIFTLGGDSAPGSDDNKDRGIEFRWHNGSAAKVGFFGYDDSASAFTFIPDATNSSEVFSGTTGNAVFNNITGNDIVAATLDISGNVDIDGTTNLDAVQVDGTITVGVNDTGYDVKLFGATSGAYMLWDESADDLILAGAGGVVVPDGQLVLGSTAISATAAELNYSDTGASVGTVVASKVVTVDANKDASSFRNLTLTGTLEAAAITVNSTALSEYIADTAGAMVSSNTETGLTVTYQDSDNTLDFAIAAAQTTITSLLATDIKIGEDDETKIDFETANTINFYANDENQLVLTDGALTPASNAIVDLGTDALEFKDAFFDGTLEADAITVNGTALNEYIADTVGAMVSSNTETNIAVTYEDGDNTLDFVIGTLNQDTTGNAATFTASANNSSDETVYPVFVDGATGSQGAETDTGFTYNPSSGLLTISGELDAGSLDISGNADIDGTLEADAITVDGTALNEYIADTVGAMVSSNTETNIAVTYEDGDNTLDFVIGTLNQDTTGNAATFTASANNSADETVYPVFVDGATGSQGAETDTGFTYNPSSGILTATQFTGNVTGNVTGNASGTAATVTGAAQSAITSLGTLTTLTVDNVIVNGTTIGHTSDTDLITLADGNVTIAGELDLTTLDVSGDADIDGTLEADAITVDGTTLAEYIADTAGAMVSSNTETGLTATYQDGDNTIDFAIAAAQTTITSLLATDIKIGEDNETKIDFEDANEINFYADNEKKAELTSGGLKLIGTTPTLTIGDAGAEDTKIVFDGNAQDFYMGLDDSADDLIIGLGSTVGTTPAISIDENQDVVANQEFRAVSYNETYVAPTSSSNATTIACESGNYFKHTLTENTTFTFSNPPASGTGFSFILHLIQDSSTRTVTWPGSVDWAGGTAPTISTGNGDDDFFVFATSDGGTIWYGFTAGQAMA